jgi:hypothetical protein
MENRKVSKTTVEKTAQVSKKKAVKEKEKEVKGEPCGQCIWWDTTTTREFKRFGVRAGLIEIRSVCRSPTSKARGHLTMKESIRSCFEKGVFVPEVKEEKKKLERRKKEPEPTPEGKSAIVLEGAKKIKKLVKATEPIQSAN